MSFPMQPIIKRNFVSSGAPTSIVLPNNALKVETYDLTNIAAGAGLQYSMGLQGMPAASAFTFTGVAPVVENLITTNGYTFFNSSVQTPGPAVATTAVSQANPAVVNTATTTGLLAGQSIVRMINVTNMQQISSIDFTVGVVVPGVSFQLAFLDSSAFAAPGAAGFYRVIPFDPIYYPRRRFITKMSQAVNMVVQMSVTHGYTVGQQVRLVVPSQFGMVQANGLLGTIIAVNPLTNSITLDIDSSGFNAFSFPTSAVAASGVSFAEVTPVGEAAQAPFQNNLDDATRNTAQTGVILGSSVIGAPGDQMLFIAYAALSF